METTKRGPVNSRPQQPGSKGAQIRLPCLSVLNSLLLHGRHFGLDERLLTRRKRLLHVALHSSEHEQLQLTVKIARRTQNHSVADCTGGAIKKRSTVEER